MSEVGLCLILIPLFIYGLVKQNKKRGGQDVRTNF